MNVPIFLLHTGKNATQGYSSERIQQKRQIQ